MPPVEQRYSSGIIVIGSTDPKVLPRDALRNADLVLARVGDRRGVLKDRFGEPRRITVAEWDQLYAQMRSGHLVYEWPDGELHQ